MVHMRSMREMIPTNSFDKIFFETAISILTNNNNPILQKKKNVKILSCKCLSILERMDQYRAFRKYVTLAKSQSIWAAKTINS